jgi:hypothetical protein
MSKYKITFTLRQHTPMIHFQHEHDGATLRATELKPKLDRFIFEKKGKIPDSWLIGKGNAKHAPALDYSIKINSSGKSKIRIIEKDSSFPPMFFGNMGEEYIGKEKALLQAKDLIEIQFFSFYPKVIEELNNLFPEFISKTNFGTRQNKGFGSFSLWNQSENRLEELSNIIPGTPYLSMRSKELRDILTVINYYYQRLKSGVNYSYRDRRGDVFCHYEKAYFLKYLAKFHPYSWEKRWLKEKFLGLSPNHQDKRYARALLGLQGEFQFLPKPPQNHCNPNSQGQVYAKGGKMKVEVSPEGSNDDDKIARIKSPITFKPIIYDKETRIYILTREYTEVERGLLSEREFEFSEGGNTYLLKLPHADHFFSVSKLIEEYNKELGTQFKAEIFTGRQSYTVQIKN